MAPFRILKQIKKVMTRTEMKKEVIGRFLELVKTKYPNYDIDDEGFGRLSFVDGNQMIQLHRSHFTVDYYNDANQQTKRDAEKMRFDLNSLIGEYGF